MARPRSTLAARGQRTEPEGAGLPGPETRSSSTALATLLFVSGALALAYETLWLRTFTQRFGAGAPAAAATISALFLGLALGSAWSGRQAPRWPRPLRAYAWLVAAAGVAAAFVPTLENTGAQLVASLDASAGGPGTLIAKTALAFAVLLVPSFLLGGTLPVAVAALDDGHGGAARSSTLLYAANLAGAILGVLAVPLLGLPALGAARLNLVLVATSLALAGLAFALDRPRVTEPIVDGAAGRWPAHGAGPRPAGTVLAFLSGLTLIGLEVAWMRMLAQVHPSSLLAFALVLALFLAALAAGAALGASCSRSRAAGGPAERSWTEASWIAAGLLTLAAPIAFLQLSDGLELLSGGSTRVFARLILLCALSFGPATVAAGMVLPLLLSAGARAGGPAAPVVGRLLAANTVGSVAGPLLVTFALFPWLGLWGSIVALGLAQLAAGLGLCARRMPRPAWWLGGAALPAFFLARTTVELPRVHVAPERGEELVWLREGPLGIVAALRAEGHLRLKLDNSYTLGGTGTAGDERWLGHLPLLLAETPRRVAFVGLGTGLTASAALRHPCEAIELFELVPEVAAAAGTVFAEANHGLLADPRVRLVLDDARTRLAATPGAFDVIVGDLVVPWRRGEAELFTREHVAGARRALAPGGIYCQWLPAFQLSQDELRCVMATFLDVFPEALLLRGDFVASQPALALVGSADERLRLDVAAIDARVRALGSTLSSDCRYLAHPAGLWLYLVGVLDQRASWLASARRNTQDRPWLELLAAAAPLSGAAAPALVGAPLLAFLQEVRLAPSETLAVLDGEHRRWQAAGEELFRASTLAAGGAEEEARRLAFAVLDGLPAEIRTHLLGADPAKEPR